MNVAQLIVVLSEVIIPVASNTSKRNKRKLWKERSKDLQ